MANYSMSMRSRRNKRWRGLLAQEAVCPACRRDLNPELPPHHPDYPTLDHVWAYAKRHRHGQGQVTLVKHSRCNWLKDDAEPSADDLEALATVLERWPPNAKSWEECRAEVYELLAKRWTDG